MKIGCICIRSLRLKRRVGRRRVFRGLPGIMDCYLLRNWGGGIGLLGGFGSCRVILIVSISLGGWFGGRFDLVGFGICLWELLYNVRIYIYLSMGLGWEQIS